MSEANPAGDRELQAEAIPEQAQDDAQLEQSSVLDQLTQQYDVARAAALKASEAATVPPAAAPRIPRHT